MGHEFSGEIASIAGEVKGLAVGDRVAAVAMGANAEYVRVPAATASAIIFPLPRELSFEEAATNEPLATSLHAANLADLSDGDTIVIISAGGIGLGVLQVIGARCAAKVCVTDVSDKRLDMAVQLGADCVIDAKEEDPYKKIPEMTGSTRISFLREPVGGVDTVFDCAGYSAGGGDPPYGSLFHLGCYANGEGEWQSRPGGVLGEEPWNQPQHHGAEGSETDRCMVVDTGGACSIAGVDAKRSGRQAAVDHARVFG